MSTAILNYDPAAAFGKTLPTYPFYDGDVTVYYDDEVHSYTRFDDDGEIVEIAGVTTVCHIIDKSAALMQWSSNMVIDYLRTMLEPNEHYTLATMEPLFEQARFNYKAFADTAADIGSIAHDWLEQYIKAQLKWEKWVHSVPYIVEMKSHLVANSDDVLNLLHDMPEVPEARSCVMAALHWEYKHSVRWIATERKIYSREHDFAGTMDGLAWVDSCEDPTCCATAFKDELAVIDWKSSNRLYDEYRYQTAAYMKAQVEELGLPITGRWLNKLGKEDGKFECWHLDYDDFLLDWQTFRDCLSLYHSIAAIKQRERTKRAAVRAEAKANREAAKAAEKEAKATAKAEKKTDREHAKLVEKEAKAFVKAEAKKMKEEAKADEKAAKAEIKRLKAEIKQQK